MHEQKEIGMDDTEDIPVVELPTDTYVYTEDDNLSTLDATVENGTGIQTGDLGVL